MHDFFGEYARSRYTNQNVSAFSNICQSALYFIFIGYSCKISLDAVKLNIDTFIESAPTVNHNYIFCTHVYQQTTNCTACSAAAVNYEFSSFEVFFNEAQCTHYSRKTSDSSTVLVIVEYRDIADFFQTVFNVIAFRGRNIFQVNACIVGFQIFNGFDNFFRVFSSQANGNSVNVCKGFEESCFTFHYRNTSFRTNIAQAKYASTVGNYSNHIATASIFKGKVFIFFNVFAGFCNTRSICQRKVMTGFNGHFANNFNFTVVF